MTFGCALDTRGQSGDDVLIEIGDSVEVDIVELEDTFSDVEDTNGSDDFSLEHADPDSDTYIPPDSDGGETGPCGRNNPPRGFHLLSPSPGASGISTRNILFDWVLPVPADPDGDPVSYTLIVGVDHDGDSATPPVPPLIEISDLTADDVPYMLSLSPADALMLGGRYQWGVDEIDSPCGHVTAGTSPRGFTTRTSPCVKIGGDVQITDDSGNSLYPSLDWTGSEYGVAWQDDRFVNDEVYFAGITVAGDKIGLDVLISEEFNESRGPSLVWNGSEHGVAWHDNRDADWEIYFRAIAMDGVPSGSSVRVTNSSGESAWPSLVWADGEFGVSWYDWRDSNYNIYFREISRDGVPIGSDIPITIDVNNSSFPSSVWTGSEYGVSWDDDRSGINEIYFEHLSSTGSLIDTERSITSGTVGSTHSSLAWADGEHGVVWQSGNGGGYQVFFARLSVEGEKIGSDIPVTDAASNSMLPSLIWTGSEFIVVWQDDRGLDWDIYSAVISAGGEKIGSEAPVTTAVGNSMQPSVVWTGSELGVAWYDDRNDDNDIYFSSLGCEL